MVAESVAVLVGAERLFDGVGLLVESVAVPVGVERLFDGAGLLVEWD